MLHSTPTHRPSPRIAPWTKSRAGKCEASISAHSSRFLLTQLHYSQGTLHVRRSEQVELSGPSAKRAECACRIAGRNYRSGSHRTQDLHSGYCSCKVGRLPCLLVARNSAHYCSPELVAKLGHDFTVYAYDFSEYETPLVGQGMLSWILASASSTPNAPAKDSQTMVTGRVCKNILGIFSNGVKETLEVKLKLVPVPTCMQKEYVENMERYHSLSQLMPEGFDYNAWSDFLRENPTLGHLAQPSPYPAQPSPRPSIGGVEPFHQMLTRHSPSQ